MDDNRTQATSAYRSGYKRESGCDIKRDSSFLSFGISPSKTKLISDAITGIRLFPGAVAPHKKNRPVNTRAEATKNRVAQLGFVAKMRPETGLKKSRGGEKKESSCHNGHIDPSSLPPLIAEDISQEVFLALFPQHRPAFFKEFTKFCLAEVHMN